MIDSGGSLQAGSFAALHRYPDEGSRRGPASDVDIPADDRQVGRPDAYRALVPQNVKDAAIALDKVQSSLKAEQLTGVKNVRNSREFNTLGQAATGGLDASATPDKFADALTALKNKYLDAQATTELTVGHKLTGELVGHGSSDLLSPTLSNGQPDPYYNGGSEDGQPLKGDDLAKVQQALSDHPEKREQILDQVRKNGYSPRGLF